MKTSIGMLLPPSVDISFIDIVLVSAHLEFVAGYVRHVTQTQRLRKNVKDREERLLQACGDKEKSQVCGCVMYFSCSQQSIDRCATLPAPPFFYCEITASCDTYRILGNELHANLVSPCLRASCRPIYPH